MIINDIANFIKKISFLGDNKTLFTIFLHEYVRLLLKSRNMEYLYELYTDLIPKVDVKYRVSFEDRLKNVLNYEIFDFLGSVYEKYLQKNYKKEYGIFYTRFEIVDYIVSLSDYDSEKIIDKTVFEPSCGSGRFLTVAIRKYKNVLRNYVKDDFEYAYKLLYDVQSNFYGVDLDEISVKIAKTNLFLQLIDEIDILYKEKAITKFNPKIISQDFFDYIFSIQNMKFDYIFGNPPYVVDTAIKRDIYKKMKNTTEKIIKAKIADRVLNSYTAFTVISAYLLKNDGILGFIIPHNILCDEQNERARRFLDSIGSIKNITFFTNPSYYIFPKIQHVVIVFIFQKTKNLPTQITYGYSKEKILNEIIASAKENITLLDTISLYDRKSNFLFYIAFPYKKKEKIKEIYNNIKRFYYDSSNYFRFSDFLSTLSNAKYVAVEFSTKELFNYICDRNCKNSIPWYKGDDIIPFYGFQKNPSKIRNRDAYICYENNGKNMKLHSILKEDKKEYIVAFNKVFIRFNHPRNIRGVIVERNEKKFVMGDTISYISVDSIEEAKKIAVLIFSIPFSFLYNITNTNKGITRKIFLSYPVPRKLEIKTEIYDKLSNIIYQFYNLFNVDITHYLNEFWYDLKSKYTPEYFITWDMLIENNEKITLSEFLKQNDNLKTEVSKRVFSIFLEKNNKEKVKDEKIMPYNLQLFLDEYENKKSLFERLLKQLRETLYENDSIIFQNYHFKNLNLEDLKLEILK